MFYKKLSEAEMMKEILYDKSEGKLKFKIFIYLIGIVPDTGDIDEEIVKAVLNS